MNKKPASLFVIALLTFLSLTSTYEIIGYFLQNDPIPRRGERLRKDNRIAFLSIKKPPIVLIGNSLLDEAVDDAVLMSLIRRRILKIWSGGAESAWWYLAYKNVVIGSGHKPTAVYFFFRDYDLTEPTSRVTGPYELALDAIASPDEPLLDELAYPRWSDRLLLFLRRHWSLYANARFFQQSVNRTVKSCAAWLIHEDPWTPDEAIQRVFDDQRMDLQLLTRRQIEASAPSEDSVNASFDWQLRNSFLPAIVAMSRQRHILLTFVRMKTRDEAISHRQPRDLLIYINHLRNYLASEECGFIDGAIDPRIGIEHFGIGDHLSRSVGRPIFTSILAASIIKESHRWRSSNTNSRVTTVSS